MIETHFNALGNLEINENLQFIALLKGHKL